MQDLIEAARVSKAWPFQEAQRLLKRYPDGTKPGGEPVLFETGYGPSGLPHIGTFQEVLRTTLVRRAFEALIGAKPEDNLSPNITLGISPDRDREIEICQNIIRACAESGIPAVKYRLFIIGITRTAPRPGRGGAMRSSFQWDEIDQGERPGIWGNVSADEYWERIDYFLERVVPVAEESKVRIACHPHDPYTPDGFMGVKRVMGTVDGLKKFVQMHESPYHGLNFCQGTVTEMLDDPGEEIADVIRWFGSREKIFNVHFRNIRGHKLDFMESFPDEGSIDFSEIIKVYQEVGYKYMLMPDHVPWISGEDRMGTAFAFCYGYITALLQSIGEPRRQAWVTKGP
ncbi:mannonate dehydratase [uncultured Hyphomonas sp.]|uniref:mannonate dehydratase n=1 Tax=uncultured Hyphomonas sp. TaxID=225298 RepID=UPI00261F03ED|nr:mannonate dehydratase [uncultured Hyphomonas sp.]